MTEQSQKTDLTDHDMLIEIHTASAIHAKHMTEFCTLAKSDKGFGRCQDKEARLNLVEKYLKYVIALILAIACKAMLT